MKRILALLVALLLLAAPVSAFADVGNVEDKSIDVKAKYTNGATTPDVYSVDVTWGAMQFTYSVGGTHVWNPETHQYTDKTTASWTADGNTVTVTNHSNKDVTVNFAYASDSAYSSVTGSFDKDTPQTLNAGVEEKAAEADKVTGTLTLSGTLASTVTELTKVGSISVSLS